MSGPAQGAPCPCCGRPSALRVERYGLIVQSEPWQVFWCGLALPGVPPMQARFLYALLQRGEVASASLEMLLHEDTMSRGVQMHMSKLRVVLRAHQIPISIQSIHGWGYRLTYHGDPA